ncbi:Hypothetical predicted protein [Mytilus galloprovincialis]|uniref:Uncharacterized protein n=2 Tax=Mytilus galloprovincialis TaxID=29158 RepID=A0A8B6BFT4_MYTGA|nr:Hypothetical predicted protein [Mytilus galloprovincialis]
MMTIGESLSTFLKVPKWRTSKRKTQKKSRPRSILDVTDIIRNIEGLDSSYHSFDVDFTYEIPSNLSEIPVKSRKAEKSRKSENRKSWMSFMCGRNNFDFDDPKEEAQMLEKLSNKQEDDDKSTKRLQQEQVKAEDSITKPSTPSQNELDDIEIITTESPIENITDSPIEIITKSPIVNITESPIENITESPISSQNKRLSWMSLMCGSQKNLDFENQHVVSMKPDKSSPKQNNKEENRKSWMSLVCGSGQKENNFRKSVYRDSGISLLSEDSEVHPIQAHSKFQSRSCDDILDSLRHSDDKCEVFSDESFECGSPSMNNLFRTSSIQENSFQIMRRRHRNVNRRRGKDCDSCYSSCDFKILAPILAGSKSEGDLTRVGSFVEREVRFSGIEETFKEKSVSSMEVCRINSVHLKSWQIRRQRRDQKNKLKRASRNLELVLSKDFEFEERLIM